MKNIVYMSALIVMSAAIFSCQRTNEKGFTHLPFQEEPQGRWGLIGTDGKVLFANEFEVMPSNAVNGLFVVRNQNGLFEYYTSAEQPKLIAGPYVQAGLFLDEVAPVVEKDSPISFINKDGSEAFTISECNGSAIVYATNFSEGMAEIIDADSKCGYIDTKGEVIIKPTYSKAFSFKEGYALVYEFNKANSANPLISVIDKGGKTILSLDDRVSSVHETFSEGLIGFTDTPQMNEWGFMNIKGEKIIKPNGKFVSVKPFSAGYAIFSDGNGYGVIDKSGEVIIRPKYQDIQYAEGQMFFAKDKDKYALINIKDEKVSDFFMDSFVGFFGGKCFVQERNKFNLIDAKGKPVNTNEYATVVNYGQQEMFVSDYFDIDVEVKRVINSITPNSIDELTLGTTAGEMFGKFKYPSKESLKGTNSMRDMVETRNIKVERIVEFSSQLATPIKERVFKRDIWSRGYYDNEVVGWKFAESANAKAISCYITLTEKASGRCGKVMDILKSMSSQAGSNITIDSTGVDRIVLRLGN